MGKTQKTAIEVKTQGKLFQTTKMTRIFWKRLLFIMHDREQVTRAA